QGRPARRRARRERQRRAAGPDRGGSQVGRGRRRPRARGMSATEAPAQPWVGRPIKRKEDPRLIMGRARYVDDINITGQLWASFVRSPEAHAKIVSIDTEAAKAAPGIIAVYTGRDLDLEAPLPMAWVPPGIEVNNPPHWSIAKD